MQNLIVKISGWGGGYIDEPISKILSDLQSAETLQMDRWLLKVERNNDCHSTDDRGEDKDERRNVDADAEVATDACANASASAVAVAGARAGGPLGR